MTAAAGDVVVCRGVSKTFNAGTPRAVTVLRDIDFTVSDLPERGLGSLIIVSQRRGPREHIYLVLLVIMAMAFLIDRAFVATARWLFPYREGQA